MKVLFKILLLLFISCRSSKFISPPTEKFYVIEAGVGANELLIGKTKITSVFALVGKNEKLEQKIIDGRDSAFVVYYYVYSTLGLTIISPAIYESSGEDLVNSVVESIYFSASARAITKDGIAINKSTLEDVFKKSGTPDAKDAYADVTILHYKKKGISFLIEKATNLVTGIEVFKENGHSNRL